MPSETTLSVEKSAADELRAARRETAAAERRDLTLSDVMRRLDRYLRQPMPDGRLSAHDRDGPRPAT